MQREHIGNFSTFQKLLNVRELTAYERLLYVALTVLAGEETECSPTIKTLARLCNCTPRHAIRVLRALEAKGYITRVAQYVGDENNVPTANKYILRFAG
jgi:DNA-binding MarR family transcriptional regulator